MPKDNKTGFLPRIDPGFPDNRMCNRRSDKSDRPVTLELIHGRDKQVCLAIKKIIVDKSVCFRSYHCLLKTWTEENAIM